MVRLGYIKDAEQSPPGFRRVYARAAPDRDRPPASEVRSWSDADGRQRYEIAFDAPHGEADLEVWAGYMRDTLLRMGWRHWWLDVNSLSQVMDRYLTEAAFRWGLAFWPGYDPPDPVSPDAANPTPPAMTDTVSSHDATASGNAHAPMPAAAEEADPEDIPLVERFPGPCVLLAVGLQHDELAAVAQRWRSRFPHLLEDPALDIDTREAKRQAEFEERLRNRPFWKPRFLITR